MASPLWKLNLCMWRKPGIFSHVSTAQDRTEVERPQLWMGVPETQNRQKSEGRTERVKVEQKE